MELQTSTEGSFAIIALSGEVDLQHSPKVRKELLKQLDGGKSVVVDLSGVSYIDSSGIASLVEALQHARHKQLHLRLAGIAPTVMQVFKLTRLDSVFSIYGTVEEGMATG